VASILVIEDDPNSLELIAYLLNAYGHIPITARDGEEGLAQAYRHTPNLILCDVQIPKVHGFEVVRQLKNDPTFTHIPVIAVTAFAMVGDRDKVLAAGFDGYITKPIAPETFIGQMETFLASGREITQPQTHTDAQEATSPAAKHARILILDNSPANLEFLRSLFQLSGYEVMAATKIDEALALASQNTPDLILSDLHLHGESGLDFISRAKADPQLRSIPFVFLTSTAWQTQDRAKGIAAGAVRYILRPIEPQALLAEVEACLQNEHPTLGSAERNHEERNH